MASNIMLRRFTIDDTSSVLTKQVFQGAGILLALALDRTDSSGLVTTIYDSARGSASDPSIYTQTGDTDLGQTVPVFLQGDADLVAGTSTAGVGGGLIFSDGLYLVNTGDTTDAAVTYKLWFKPLIKKTVNITTTGAAGSGAGAAQIWQGPALWHGYAITLDPASPSTVDIVFRDSITDAAPTVMTKTNYATTPGTKVLRKVVTTTGEDEAGAAVTCAATGTYGNNGIYLETGLRAVVAQSNAFTRAVSIDGLFEK